jgi:Signal peptidase (SPase) II
VNVPQLFDVVALRVTILVFFGAVSADLLSKAWAVAHPDGLTFNSSPDDLSFRIVMSFVAVAVCFALARLAALRGLGRQWGVWTGCALLVAGTLANGISPLLWARGVPDFIDLNGGWVWNVADFEIALGLAVGIPSVALSAVLVYSREKVAQRRS